MLQSSLGEFHFESAGVQGKFSFITVDPPFVKKVIHGNKYVHFFITLPKSSLK